MADKARQLPGIRIRSETARFRRAAGIVFVDLPVSLLTSQHFAARLVTGALSGAIGFASLFGLDFAIGTLTIYLGNV